MLNNVNHVPYEILFYIDMFCCVLCCWKFCYHDFNRLVVFVVSAKQNICYIPLQFLQRFKKIDTTYSYIYSTLLSFSFTRFFFTVFMLVFYFKPPDFRPPIFFTPVEILFLLHLTALIIQTAQTKGSSNLTY